MKVKNLIAAVSAALITVASPAFAGLQSQIDTTTNTITALDTNTYALYGDVTGSYTNGIVLASPNAFIDCTKTTSASFEVGGWFANTAAVASNVTFQVYGSVDVGLWQSFTNVTVVVPALSTNWAFTTFTISEGGINNALYSEYALRAVLNPNASVTAPPLPTNTNASSVFLKAFTRTGI